jgi:DNA-binding GntR family transcriptional regulator
MTEDTALDEKQDARARAPRQIVQRSNFKDQVYQLIRDEIMTGLLMPGSQYSMGDLAMRYGASRTPVREALIELESKGFVRVLRGVGFEVVAPSPEYLRDTLQLREILETRAMIAICGRITDAEFEQAKSLMMEVHDVAKRNDAILYRELDREFHIFLAGLARNDRLATLVAELRDTQFMPGLTRIASAGNLVERSSQHLVLLDAIREGDVDGVRTCMNQHLGFSRSSFVAPALGNHIDASQAQSDSRNER